MSRELRRVPPNWEHPRYEKGERNEGEYKPLHDEAFDDAFARWTQEATAWATIVMTGGTPEQGWYPSSKDKETWARVNPLKAYAEWYEATPDADLYRDRYTQEPTAYQIYETVSEGTPLSPVLPTREAVIEWCMQTHPSTTPMGIRNGWTVWNAVSREAAERFVEAEWAPTMFTINEPGKPLVIKRGAEIFEPGDKS